jgi:alpha-L-rhamnosidase
VKDEKGRMSAWSDAAYWSIGPRDAGDWTAQWIGTDQLFKRGESWPPADNTLADPWFRTAVDLNAEPKRAMIHVASVGYHEVYVNGNRAGDQVLAPCVTDHSQRARYVTYDITTLLRPGRNAIGLWLGTSWSIFPPMKSSTRPATPIVIAQADIELKNGRSLRVNTDASWKTHASPNTLLGVWDFMHFGGELYDARREMPDWCSPDLDDSAWQAVTVYDPKLTISAQRVEPNRLQQPIYPVSIEEIWPGTWRIDMGVNFAGWMELKLHGEPGATVEIFWSERQKEEMTHRMHSTYIMGDSGEGEFRNRFNYGSGRWITIKGANRKPLQEEVQGWSMRTDFVRTGVFKCSNDRLNRVYDVILWTFENLTLGGYVVDCPQRERMGYGGDGHATIQTGLDNYGTAAFYAKWAEDWRDVQGKKAAWGVGVQVGEPGAGGDAAEAGDLPYTAPTYWGGGGPAWSGFCVTLSWEVYKRHGNKRILSNNFSTIRRWLAFLETKASENLLRRWGGEWDFLGDWLWPGAEGVNGDTRETLFFNNCYWIYNLETAARIADVLDHTELSLAWRARAHRVRRAVHKEFYNSDDASYVNGLQSYLAIALVAEVPPLEVRHRVEERLAKEILEVRNGHFWGGITGGAFIVRHLIDANRSDLMFEMVNQPDYPGWADMLAKGATTVWEDWEGAKSLLHSSYLHAGAWFIQGLGGIRPGPDGKTFRRFEIRPGIWPDCPLEYVEATTGSPFGLIKSGWRRENGIFIFSLTIPPGTQADFHLPTALGYRAISENGQSLERINGVQESRSNQGRDWVLTLDPGQYTLRAEPAAPIPTKRKT